MQRVPIYILSANGERSPVNDHPLCLFNPQEDAAILAKEYNIPNRYLGTIMSPWAAKRLHEFGGDITKFKVIKVWPSILEQIAIAKLNPVMRIIRIFPHWWEKWISVSWSITPRTILTPMVIPVHCAAQTKG